MTKRDILKQIDDISFQMVEADGDTYFELQKDLEELQEELEVMKSFESAENDDDLNFNVGNPGAYYE